MCSCRSIHCSPAVASSPSHAHSPPARSCPAWRRSAIETAQNPPSPSSPAYTSLSQSPPSYTSRRPGSGSASLASAGLCAATGTFIASCILRSPAQRPSAQHSRPASSAGHVSSWTHVAPVSVEGEDERGEDAESDCHPPGAIFAGRPFSAEVRLRGGCGPSLHVSHLLARAGRPPSTPPPTPHPPRKERIPIQRRIHIHEMCSILDPIMPRDVRQERARWAGGGEDSMRDSFHRRLLSQASRGGVDTRWEWSLGIPGQGWA